MCFGNRFVHLVACRASWHTVHEWCLVCYGWLALCLRNNCHPTYLFSFCLGLYSLSRLWVSCVAYLRHGIVPIDQSCFRLVSS
ncbi:hypothetical protein HanPI659440_Chr00c32g0737841 [Helianthus annuus]|nr:hypothetical protein HanPI659440_Chr00c32g0737841 [Helianthus annuus]